MVEVFRIPINLKFDAEAKKFAKNLEKGVSGVGTSVSGGQRGLGVEKLAIGETVGDIIQSAGKETKTASKKTGGLLSGILGKVGLAAGGIGILIALLDAFKPIVNIAKQVVKMLFEFLRPIADMVVLLLIPILQIIKPILQVVRQIMAPFRQLAFKLSREAVQAGKEGDPLAAAGLFGLSFQAIATGVQAVFGFFGKTLIDQIVDLSGFLLKQITGVLISLIGPILSFFGVNVDNVIISIEGFIDRGTKFIKDAMGFGLATIFSLETLGIAKMAELLGADVSKEYQKVNDILGEIFIGEKSSFKSTFENMTTAFENTLLPKFDDVLLGPDGIVAKFQKAADDINSINIQGQGGGGGGFFSGFGGIVKRAIRSAATPFVGVFGR